MNMYLCSYLFKGLNMELVVIYVVSALIVTIAAKIDLFYSKRPMEKDFWAFAALMPFFNLVIAFVAILGMLAFLITWVPKK